MTPLTRKKRPAPLTAAAVPAPTTVSWRTSSRTTSAPEDIAAPVVTASSADAAMRDQRFTDGVRTLRVGGASLRLEERILMVLGGVIAPLGIIVVLLGWCGRLPHALRLRAAALPHLRWPARHRPHLPRAPSSTSPTGSPSW